MGSNLTVNKEIEEYINNNSTKLHSVQKEIIKHNDGLGDIKRMQISISQCHFLHLLIKISKIKTILEIGTFTGLSTLSMSLALPKDGSITALAKNQETSEIAVSFRAGPLKDEIHFYNLNWMLKTGILKEVEYAN